ncbi:hypothetical protein FH968_10815 [Buttiauxella sp. B2]|uniref:winged helix-turn-helix transcriptional regulator n=1 Tax=Buttiauxella sp. B2 TaxID=2587812 RepID=UPI00111EF0FC|nr:winged helix-turn-helix transcriptional regulator [Buttiauxella sp. B2]TNV20486.1 hypothetical protein FH968_10815 [Buttiauxella sp. B2]
MKPEEYFHSLFKSISDPSRIKDGRERQIISLVQYAEPMSILLHEGTIALYRGQDHLLLSNAKAPFIIGLNLLFPDNGDVYIQARDAIRYEIIPRNAVEEIIRKENLWEQLAYIFMYNTKNFIKHNFATTGVSTYDLIRNNLLALMNESDELRSKTNACDYIHERTLLSRSGIMKILSDLRKGGHIDISRGVLLSINTLPAKY